MSKFIIWFPYILEASTNLNEWGNEDKNKSFYIKRNIIYDNGFTVFTNVNNNYKLWLIMLVKTFIFQGRTGNIPQIKCDPNILIIYLHYLFIYLFIIYYLISC